MQIALTRLSAAFFAAVALILTSQAASAEGWRVVDKVGEVRAGAAGMQKTSFGPNEELAADSWVETGKNGRAVLTRGRETIAVAPNSRLQLPDEEVNGNTQVLQTLGSAFYQIGKQAKPHFQVDAPALAAVVKGTAFTVTVNGNESSVAVSEGLVQVVTADGSANEFVRPGFIATVAHGTSTISVERGAATEATPAQDAKPKGDKSSSVSIPATIGDLDLDIKNVSEGLAYGEATPVTETSLVALVDGDDTKGKNKEKSNNGTVVAVDTGASGGAAAATPVVQTVDVPVVTDLAPDLGDAGGGNGNGATSGGGNGNGVAAGHDKENKGGGNAYGKSK